MPAATITTAAQEKQNLAYTGSAQELVEAAVANGGTVQYSLDGTNYSESIPTGTNAANYTVYYKVAGDAEHSDSEVFSTNVSIAKAKVAIPTDRTGLVYNGNDQIGVEYSEVGIYSLSGDIIKTNAGEYTATASLTDKDNYEWDIDTPTSEDQSIEWFIAKKPITISWDKDNFTYDGQAHLPTPTASDAAAAIVTDPSDGYIAVGEYTVTASLEQGSDSEKNYTITSGATQKFTITPAGPYKGDPANIKATDKASSARDNQSTSLKQDVDFVLKDGGVDFTEAYTDTFTGDRKVTIYIGNFYYELTATGTQVDFNDLTVEVKNVAYTGGTVAGAVTITDKAGKALAEGTDYELEIPESTAIGTYQMKITGLGKYTGTTTVEYKILPKTKAVSKLAKGKKSFTVKWVQAGKAARKNITGYQVRYSTSKSFDKAVKTKTVKKNSAAKVTVKKLKKNKKYYVQLRTYKTVDGEQYYSEWSKTKTVKTR